MALRDAIIALQAHAATAGANEYPDDPVEANVAWPFSVCYPATGRITAESSGIDKALHTLWMDVHVNRQDLPTDVQTMLSFMEAFLPLLVDDPTLGGAVQTILMGEEAPITYQFGEMEYAGVKTVGFRFTITVKIRS